MRIFISYRREDSAGYAGRMYDTLRERFGQRSVFIDVDGIRPGDDFADAIGRTLRQCDVLLAVIGPHWTQATDAEGRPRLFNEGDFVRLEIESALAIDLRIVPVLVGRARMPDRSVVPESMWPILRRHATELNDVGWNDDLRALIEALPPVPSTAESRAGPSPIPSRRRQPSAIVPTRRRSPSGRRKVLTILGLAAALVVTLGIVLVGDRQAAGPDGVAMSTVPPPTPSVATPAADPSPSETEPAGSPRAAATRFAPAPTPPEGRSSGVADPDRSSPHTLEPAGVTTPAPPGAANAPPPPTARSGGEEVPASSPGAETAPSGAELVEEAVARLPVTAERALEGYGAHLAADGEESTAEERLYALIERFHEDADELTVEYRRASGRGFLRRLGVRQGNVAPERWQAVAARLSRLEALAAEIDHERLGGAFDEQTAGAWSEAQDDLRRIIAGLR